MLIRGDELLLAKRSKDRHFYPGVDVIGGHCEANESPADTLVRELREEIGVDADAFEEIAVLDERQSGEHGEAAYHMFLVTAWRGGEPRLIGAEHSELRWTKLAEMRSLPLAHPAYLGLFRAAFERAGVSLR